MPYKINDKLKNMTPYEPIEGNYRIRLDANESFLTVTEELKSEILSAVSGVRFNRYPDPYAKELCALFASYYGVDSALVTAGNGSDELICLIISAFLQKGESLLCFEPEFSMYSFYSEVAEARCVKLGKGDGYRIDPAKAIETADAEGVRMIVFSNPCNPTSTALPREDVLKIIDGSGDRLVVVDEAYMDFYGQSVLDEVARRDNLIVLRTCSKAVGMAAIRLGFAIAPKRITDALRAVKSPYNVNSVTQAIGCAVLSHPQEISKRVEKINASRDMLADALHALEKEYPGELHVVAHEANFAFVECDSSAELFDYLKGRGIIIRYFGKTLRITAGRNHENAELINAMRDYFNEKKDDKNA